MSHLAQLSEAEIEERFQISGLRPVAFMLAGFVKSAEQFSVHIHGGQETFLTTLLAVLPEKKLLIFDCSGSGESNRHLLGSDHNLFISHPGGIRVQFDTGPASEIMHGGGRAFSAALPSTLIRMQRRDSFRIETPRVHPLQFFGRLPGGVLLTHAIHDISVDGIGLTAASLPDGIEVGQVLGNCRFRLPDDDHDLFFQATITHVSDHEGRAGIHQWRIGLRFNKMPSAEQKRIQRYIARVERERHELL